MSSGYAPVNGLKMYYEVHGESEPLVMLHGGVLSAEMFGPYLPSLTAGRQVILMELQGHARTADIDREISLRDLASDVEGVLDHLGVRQADLFGFSLGGGVALQLALSSPERVRRLAVASISTSADGGYDLQDPAHQHRLPTPEDFGAMRQDYARLSPEPGHFEEFMAKLQRSMATAPGWTFEELGTLSVPTLIMLGDTDFFKPSHAVEIHEAVKGSQLAILPNTTHMSLAGDTELVLPILRRFLAG
jgi:pimeloyl-ACP methyl ester carboxylesterase